MGFRSAAGTTSVNDIGDASTPTCVVDAPAGIVDGDHLYVGLSFRVNHLNGGADPDDPPASLNGFTLIADLTYTTSPGWTAGSGLAVYYKAASGEPSTWTWDFVDLETGTFAAVALAYTSDTVIQTSDLWEWDGLALVVGDNPLFLEGFCGVEAGMTALTFVAGHAVADSFEPSPEIAVTWAGSVTERISALWESGPGGTGGSATYAGAGEEAVPAAPVPGSLSDITNTMVVTGDMRTQAIPQLARYLRFYILEPPANDNLADVATIVSCHGTTTVCLTGATAEVDEPFLYGPGFDQQSAWFKWVAPKTGTLSLTTEGSFPGPGGTFFFSELDTVLSVYTGTNFADFVEIASNDEEELTGDFNLWSALTFDCTEGVTYWFQVSTFFGGTGYAVLNWACNTSGSELEPRLPELVKAQWRVHPHTMRIASE